jgi:AAA domain
MANMSTLVPNTPQHILVFGGPKTGKTELVGKLAARFKLLWFDLEQGSSTLFKLPMEYKKNIELMRIPDNASFPIAIETCLKLVKGKASVCEEHGKVTCMLCKKEGKPEVEFNLPALKDPNTIVVFDTTTQLTHSAISNITKNEPDEYKMQTDDWGKLSSLMDIFFSRIQTAPYHCVCIAHEQDSEVDSMGKGTSKRIARANKLIPVAGSRNFSRTVGKYFDHLVYTEIKNKKYVAASSGTYSTLVLTGTRSDIAIEDTPELGLLPFFTQADSYPTPVSISNGQTPAQITEHTTVISPVEPVMVVPSSAVNPTPVGGKESAKEILARLKAGKK